MHGDEVWAGPGDDIVYGNNGSALGPIDCGPGFDTLVINHLERRRRLLGAPAHPRGRRRRLRADHPRPSPVNDPTRGIRYTAPESGGVKTGTERNDHMNGGHGSDRLYGLGGDDDFWADQNADEGGFDARDLDRRRRRQRHDLRRPRLQPADRRPGRRLPPGRRGQQRPDRRRSATTRSAPAAATTASDAGAGDDTIYATSTKRRGHVDCGPGTDTVYYGLRKPAARGCERFVDQFDRN